MTNQINNQSIIPSTDVIQLTLTLKMTTTQVVETSVTVNNNSPIQDYVHPDDQTRPTFEMTPGFKPFKLSNNFSKWYMVSMIPMNTSRYKRVHSAGYETWIIHHGSCFTWATLFEIGINKTFSRTPRQVRCSDKSFLSGDTMKNNNCPSVHCNIDFG